MFTRTVYFVFLFVKNMLVFFPMKYVDLTRTNTWCKLFFIVFKCVMFAFKTISDFVFKMERRLMFFQV